MATQDTNVAGVTFYNTDFKSIKKSSKVSLKPNPNNKYDRNAIEVWIDGSIVGYIKKEINQALLRHINNGEDITVKVKKVVGGDNGRNYGIIISVITLTHSTPGANMGEYMGAPREEFKVSQSLNPLCISKGIEISWEKFLEKTKGVPIELQRPEKPDCHREYIKASSFFERLFNNQEKRFSEKLIADWKNECGRIDHHNQQRFTTINSYKKEEYRNEYGNFNERCKVESAFSRNGIICSSEEEIKNSQKEGFLTIYENILFEKIRERYTCYQQVVIGKTAFDILLASKEKKCLWVIEVDGIIHRFKEKYEKDKSNESLLLQKGISLIRVSNYLVKNNLREVVDKVIREVR